MLLRESVEQCEALAQKRLAQLYDKRTRKFAYLPKTMCDGSVIWLQHFWLDSGVQIYKGKYYRPPYINRNFYHEKGNL